MIPISGHIIHVHSKIFSTLRPFTWRPKRITYNHCSMDDPREESIQSLKIGTDIAHAVIQHSLHFFIRTISPITSLSVSIVWNYSMCPEIFWQNKLKRALCRPFCLWHVSVASIFVRRDSETLDHNRMLQRIKRHNDNPDSSGKWTKVNAIRNRKCSNEDAEWRKKERFLRFNK